MQVRFAFALPVLVAAALLAGCSSGRHTISSLTAQPSTSPGASTAASASARPQGSGAATAGSATPLVNGPMSPQAVVKMVSPSVVRIEVAGSNSGGGFFGRGGSANESGSGTGIIIDTQGHILTNNHVITLETNNVASKIQVLLADGKTLDAKVVGRDPGTDLAVLQVSGDSFTPVKFVEPGSVEVGEPVLAIGYALDLQGTPTVTSGVVSATDRVIPETTTSISGAIQTDAAINPGNSGGPLVDLSGNVVGINTAGLGSQTQGIFFAISADVAQPVAKDLVANGKIVRGFIGIQTASVTPDEVQQKSLPVNSGAEVEGVQPGTPAEKAGLRAGDIIVKIDNKDINNTGDLQQALINDPPGTKITVTYYRGSDKKTADLTLTTRPDNS
jgi:S1-C subfamily serine protease